jgi:GNAT superfamily N-acetyltransferase
VTIRLCTMTDGELDEWLEMHREIYIADRVRTGETPEQARTIALSQYALLFPDNRPAPGQLAFRVVDDETAVGWLWIGPRPDQVDDFWVWDVTIEESERGKGYGRAAMLLAEEEAAKVGAKTLGLNVFGYNTVARRLYESLGYETTAVQMLKALE